MKRSRSEHINAAVGIYLKKRQFAENETFKKNDLKLNQTMQEMALCRLVRNEASIGNAFSFSSISGDATAIDQHFTKLKTFISNAVEPYKTELSHVLFPMFVHLYLELVYNGQKTPAQKFHNRHHGMFVETSKYKTTVDTLKEVVDLQDILDNPDIKAFRENKYVVNMTDDAIHYLQRFLKENDHLILLQVFNHHIEVQDLAATSLHLFNGNAENNSPPTKCTDTKSTPPNVPIKGLQQAIKKIHDGPPPLPSICLYTLGNTCHGISSVATSQNLQYLAAGFENSSITMWNLVPEDGEPLDKSGNDNAANPENLKRPTVAEQTPQKEKSMRAHSGSVYGLAFSPDSRYLLSCSEDTTVRAWDMDDCTNVTVYRGHNYPVWDIDYSSFGFYFATASQDRTAKLWILDRTYPVRIFAGHNQDVDCVKFHPNCNYIATGSSDRTIRLWNVQDGKMMRIFQGHRGSIFTLAFSPNGQLLASAGEDRRIKIWDLAAGSLFKELRGHVDTVYSLCFNRDSSVLVSGGLDNSIRVWDVRKGVSVSNSTDGHTSPELLSSFVTKMTNLLFVKYSIHNLLIAVGAHPSI